MGEQKKYYWLKLQRDFFKRHDIRIVEGMDNGKDYILLYLKLLVESVDHEGNLRFSETIPYDEKMLSIVTNTDIDIVRSAMKVFNELGMIEILEDKTIFMTEVKKMIGSAADNDNAKRQQRFRDRQKALNLLDTVTNSNASVTDEQTNNNESKSKRKSKSQSIEKEIDKNIKDKTLCSEPPASSPIAKLILKDGSVYEVTQDEVNNLKNLYRGANVEKELRHMEGWCSKNPEKRKTRKGIGRFITNWLSHADESKETGNAWEDIK